LGWVGGVGAAVPGEQRARGVAGHGIKFFAQDFAADGEALLGIAQRGEKQGIEAGFARDLPLLFVYKDATYLAKKSGS
jgi:hypothetical protein